ncbi:D-alanine--D-alanine ligase [Verrucomicrobiota bacterium]|jgi:D-alanine-D-alanine ligase|nr:D-alanine--D-alanine ligase [Verrucomicrobiota bacterium]
MPFDLTNIPVAVLMGGPGSERKVSLKSGEGVMEALRSIGAVVTAVDVTGANFTVPAVTRVAFNVVHGTFGEDGQIQRILEARGIPYTGEGVRGSELAIDKIASKRRFVERGVPTAKSEIIRGGAKPTLPLPLVIKAPKEGSSVGVYIVKSADELASSLEQAWKFGDELLVEEFIAGRELTVGVVGDLALPVIEIRAKKDFYNFDNKYPFLNPNAAGADHFCPAPLEAATTKLVQDTALAAHRALDLEIYSRVDILLTDAGLPFVLEVNTIPGMTPVSLLPEAAAAVGISYAELCRRIIELSLAARPSRSSSP